MKISQHVEKRTVNIWKMHKTCCGSCWWGCGCWTCRRRRPGGSGRGPAGAVVMISFWFGPTVLPTVLVWPPVTPSESVWKDGSFVVAALEPTIFWLVTPGPPVFSCPGTPGGPPVFTCPGTPGGATVFSCPGTPGGPPVFTCPGTPGGPPVFTCPEPPCGAPVFTCPEPPGGAPVFNCPDIPGDPTVFTCPEPPDGAPVFNCPDTPGDPPVFTCPEPPCWALVSNCPGTASGAPDSPCCPHVPCRSPFSVSNSDKKWIVPACIFDSNLK